jgi:LysR family hydrogen peroxide-inducible transcriptional activator
MEIQQLRSVLAVADAGNFTRAAERLDIAQPSLSQHILNLEKELGQKLFHRLGRKAVPTEAGKGFIERARRIIFEIESATKEIGDSPAMERRITVGAIPTLAPYVIPSLIQRCRKRFANLRVSVHEDFKARLLEGILEGHLDLALVSLPVDDARIHAEPLLREPLLVAVARDHPLADKAKVTPADLEPETFIMLGSFSSLTAQVRSFFGNQNFEPRIGFRCAQVATVKGLVAIGAGISILPRVATSPDDREITYIQLHGAEPFREIGVIRHLQRYQSRGAEQFLGVVRDRARELVGGAPV